MSVPASLRVGTSGTGRWADRHLRALTSGATVRCMKPTWLSRLPRRADASPQTRRRLER